MSKRNSRAVRNLLRHITDDLEVRVEEFREEAGFHALEALEALNQDATESRELALKLSAKASAYLEIINLIRGRCPSCSDTASCTVEVKQGA